jgi:lipid II:glycine glycyltransferase (peptidoglycan interpeptide bridge formation enzyme)
MHEDAFRQAIRALRNEFTCKRKLVLRLFPALFHEEHERYLQILEQEGFSPRAEASPSQTILMSLERPLEELREGMAAHWQRELKAAERKQMQSRESVEDAQFGEFIEIYKEMVSRKHFVEPNDINQFRSIQALLPEELKMTILLCTLGEDTAAGVIYSAIGDTAVYLFGATSNAGMKAKGSYLLQWKALEALKQRRTPTYNLHGINKARNPGTYKFKSDFGGSNGREVSFIGRFESQPSAMTFFCIKTAEDMLSRARSARKRWANRRVAEKAAPQEK